MSAFHNVRASGIDIIKCSFCMNVGCKQHLTFLLDELHAWDQCVVQSFFHNCDTRTYQNGRCNDVILLAAYLMSMHDHGMRMERHKTIKEMLRKNYSMVIFEGKEQTVRIYYLSISSIYAIFI